MQTFVIIKPDAIEHRLVGKIIKKFEFMGLRITKMELKKKNVSWCHAHYYQISDEEVLKNLINFMVDAPLIGIILEGKNAIERVRDIVGSVTNPSLGTIRKDFGANGVRNLVHASDSEQSVKEETELFWRN